MEQPITELIIDLETLGVRHDSAIIAIGAVGFSFEHAVTLPFYRVICSESAIESGGLVDHSTKAWWEKQSVEAKQIFTDPARVPIRQGMKAFKEFVISVRKSNPGLELNVWGNDNTFDVSLCEDTFKRLKMICPWKFFEGRSVRTLVDLGQRFGFNHKRNIRREGVHHNALDDCFHEIKYCKAIMDDFKEKIETGE